ncbi:MAG: PorP/SprF family type IX secretion system membrane protein [Bacteroidota bacterium]
MKLKLHLLLAAMLFLLGIAHTQDIHFSQYYHSPLNLSPALVGVHSGEIRFVGNYRNQWENVGVDYTTFSGAVERKFYLEKLQNSYFSAGLLINHDQAGTSKLSRTNIGVSASYSLQLSPVFFMTAGAHLGINQRAFKTTDLTFDNQFDGEQFDPSRSREAFDNTSIASLDLASGLNFRLQPQDAHPLTKRSKLDVGLGVFHLNTPREGFNLQEDIRLDRRYSAYLQGTVMLHPTFDLVIRGMAQFQGQYRENVVGGGAKIFINRKPARELAVLLGGSYRFDTFGDAMIPHIEFHIQQWMLGLNYDVNISEFQAASERRGGLEVAVRYLFTPVKPPEKTKVCPII